MDNDQDKAPIEAPAVASEGQAMAPEPTEKPHIVVTAGAQGLTVDIPNALIKAAVAAAFLWLNNKLPVDAQAATWVCHGGAAAMLASLWRSIWGSNKATEALLGISEKIKSAA